MVCDGKAICDRVVVRIYVDITNVVGKKSPEKVRKTSSIEKDRI